MPNPTQLKPGQTAYIDPAQVSAGIAPQTDDQKRLRKLVERRHPLYAERSAHWDFIEGTYEGGREWFKANVFKYIKEGDKEFSERLDRAYRFNHTREVVDLLNKYLFKQNIVRNVSDAPQSVQTFWERATKKGLTIGDFAKQASKRASISGRIGIVVDNAMKKADGTAVGEGEAPVTKADEKAMDVRTYAYIVGPRQLCDYSFDDEGNLQWILIEESKRNDDDPFSSDGREVPRWRLWTTMQWILLEERTQGRKKIIVEVERGTHGLNEVPVILHDHVISDEDYCSQSLIDDIAYLDRAVANYLSNLDAIIQDQTFSQLAMPAQNVLPGSDTYTTMLDMGTKRVFLYDGEGGNKPEYLSPDPKQAQMILAVINKIINEIYHTVGLAGERTKQDNAMGIDNSSGVAKAYDFERVNALLAAKADSLEVLENKVARLVALWNGEDDQIKADLVSYPNNFDTRGLYDEFDIAARLMLVDAPDAVRQEQMKTLIDKLFPQLAADLKATMLAEITKWPIDPIEFAADMAKATGKAGDQAPDQKSLQNTANNRTAKDTMDAK